MGRKLFSVVVLLFADLLVVCQNYAMLDPEKKKTSLAVENLTLLLQMPLRGVREERLRL